MYSISSILFHHLSLLLFLFFFNDTATTEIYTLSLHDALPILAVLFGRKIVLNPRPANFPLKAASGPSDGAAAARACGKLDRKSTRLNSSHTVISYAVFCLKKKKKNEDVKRANVVE